MNILLAHFQIQDYGGIVNYSEFLARGFKAQGHNIDSVMLKNKGKSGYPKTKDRSETQGWEYGDGLDLWMHQKSGWEGMECLNYVTDVMDGECWTPDHDLVIYIVPVPTCSKATKGDDHWLKLFRNSSAKQIAIVHDGNMQKLYPHILQVCDKLDGVVCVHDASFNSCEILPVRRTFIPNPHEHDEFSYIRPIDEREDGFVSLQTFKRWKRVDDLIRAIPHMAYWNDKIICGGGIEYHYMTSTTKCKPEYRTEDGTRIWDEAIKAGMDFKGYVTTEDRDYMLKEMKLLIDPSWSKKYSELGSHFNRVMVEAMALGCVPMCTDLAMNNSLLFTAGVNYIEIPYDISPENYGALIDKSIADEDLLQQIQNNNMELMGAFDKQEVAKAILEFAFGDAGVLGEPTAKLISDSLRKMEHFDDF